jgi:hypothetical protein
MPVAASPPPAAPAPQATVDPFANFPAGIRQPTAPEMPSLMTNANNNNDNNSGFNDNSNQP